MLIARMLNEWHFNEWKRIYNNKYLIVNGLNDNVPSKNGDIWKYIQERFSSN